MSHHATTRAWESGAKGNDMLVLLALADFAGGHDDPYDYAYPSVPTLAKKTGLSPRTVQRCLRSLEDAKVIKRTGEHTWKPGKVTTQYCLTGAKTTGRQPDTPDSDDTTGATQCHPTLSNDNPAHDGPNGPSSSKPDDIDEKQIIGSLIDYWKARCQHPAAKATRDRRQKVAARLREGYTPDDIRTGIDGAAIGAYVNDAGKRFDDIELICRSGSKLESFMERAKAAPVRNGTVHPIAAARKPSHAELTAELDAANPRLQGHKAEPTRQLPERTNA